MLMIATALFSALLGVVDIGETFADPEAWKAKGEEFVNANRMSGFRFASDKHDIANCLNRGGCTWYGVEVWEAKLYYGANGLDRIELSVYNRGDDSSGGSMTNEKLQELLADVASKAEPNGKLKSNPTKKKLKSGGYQLSQRFNKGPNDVELSWGMNGAKAKDLTADYVRVAIFPKGKGASASKGTKGVVSGTKAKSNIKKEENGDVWIDNIPMVDQGAKGYCAAATSERILRYYGFNIDEHEIAQMAGTTAGGGTSIDEMITTVKTVGSKCRLGFVEIVSMNGSMKEIDKELKQYNQMAKSMKKPQLNQNQFMNGNTLMVADMRDAMDKDVLLKLREKDFRYKRFLDGIKKSIDQGIPVFWGVSLGIFPEEKLTPQTKGGHMRLIIGYNKTTKELLFSDTWGQGHEKKRVQQNHAFGMTSEAFYLKPL